LSGPCFDDASTVSKIIIGVHRGCGGELALLEIVLLQSTLFWKLMLEDMAICMSKCTPNVVNGTGVKSGVSWVPDGVSLIHLIHQE